MSASRVKGSEDGCKQLCRGTLTRANGLLRVHLTIVDVIGSRSQWHCSPFVSDATNDDDDNNSINSTHKIGTSSRKNRTVLSPHPLLFARWRQRQIYQIRTPVFTQKTIHNTRRSQWRDSPLWRTTFCSIARETR